jgi:hypothetical protein
MGSRARLVRRRWLHQCVIATIVGIQVVNSVLIGMSVVTWYFESLSMCLLIHIAWCNLRRLDSLLDGSSDIAFDVIDAAELGRAVCGVYKGVYSDVGATPPQFQAIADETTGINIICLTSPGPGKMLKHDIMWSTQPLLKIDYCQVKISHVYCGTSSLSTTFQTFQTFRTLCSGPTSGRVGTNTITRGRSIRMVLPPA